MLIATPDPRVFQFRLVDWNASQPAKKDGDGLRTELVCEIEFNKVGIRITKHRTEYYERATPVVGWQLAQTVAAADAATAAILKSAILVHLMALLPEQGEEPEE